MTAGWRVSAYDEVIQAALEAAPRHDVYLIARISDTMVRHAVAQNGRLDGASGGRVASLGLQVFTQSGHCGFTSTDRLSPAEAADAVRRATLLARAAAVARGETSLEVFELQVERFREWPRAVAPLDAFDALAARTALLEAHRELMEQVSGCSLRSSWSATDDEWRIARSDGTDVWFSLSRADGRHELTARQHGRAATVSAVVSGTDPAILLAGDGPARLRRRAAQAYRRARDAASAPAVSAGSYRLVLDHTLAKALAHEAFGHAAESDAVEFSILARDGRLRLGERVAPEHVSIVDEPIAGDVAWQPIDANGRPRRPVRIVDRGVLNGGLGDVFSARRAGIPETGAARAQSARSQPLPRMTNIRIECANPLPMDDPDELLTPSEVGDALRSNGLLPDEQPTLLLKGWAGGQVNPRLGDFVFTCSAAYDLSDGAAPRGPALFSGKSLSALSAISAALGPLRLDAAGYCGKGGQSVPTSGGSHAYLVLDVRPDVHVCGAR
ncbi:MAG: TldD/PmbA family protein [Chloroflexi bacterium]|nr:TldD/PmbA family protein [Chloroflexota bacterium]